MVKNLLAMQETPIRFMGHGEGISYPLQYSWAVLVAQLVKNPPSMCETWARSLSWKDPLEKGKSIHASILAWKILWTIVHGVAKSLNWQRGFHFHFLNLKNNITLTLIKFQWWKRQQKYTQNILKSMKSFEDLFPFLSGRENTIEF